MTKYIYTWGYWGDLKFTNNPMISKYNNLHAKYIYHIFGNRGLPAIAGISIKELK